MNPKTVNEALNLFDSVRKSAEKLKNIQTIICPPDIFLGEIAKKKRGKKVSIGAQDVSVMKKGAFTGEISVAMLKNLGVEYVIVGHSERRALGDSDEIVYEKLKLVLDAGIKAILCVGEKERNETGEYFEFLARQIKSAASADLKGKIKNLIIAYEPIWAIGKTADEAIDASSLHEMVLFIKKVLTEIFGKTAADKTSVLYGGSVENENADDLIKNSEINGFLVGHESLDAEKISEILEVVNESQ